MRAAGRSEVAGVGAQVRTMLVLLMDICRLLSILYLTDHLGS